ncbi:MAG: trypsin-like peptidase domain-containing protein [Planctomycetota bacterium]
MRTLLTAILLTLCTALPAVAEELPIETRSRTLELAGLEEAFRTAGRDLAPSVVAISAVGPMDVANADHDGARLTGEQLDNMLGRKPRVVGTGFAFEADGYILTNQHVIADADRLWVTTDDGTVLPALVLGSDPRGDLAVLKVAVDLPIVPLADTPAERGQWCIALGNPVGLATAGEMALSVGVVSATDRALPKLAREEDRHYHGLIQTTAEINPGNSGGPLFDLQGNVIGIVAAVILPQKQTHGLSFALPVDDVLRAKVDRLKRGLAVEYATFGLRLSDAERGGAVVRELAPDSAVGELLRVGDVIEAVNESPMHDAAAFIRTANRLAPLEPVWLTVRRADATFDVEVTPQRQPSHKHAAVTVDTRRLNWRGVTFGPLPDHFEGDGVVALVIRPDSPMADTWHAGTVVTDIAGQPVSDLVALQSVLLNADEPTMVTALDSD